MLLDLYTAARYPDLRSDCGLIATCVQAELVAAKATGELLRTQIVTKVQAVAAHERRVERLEAQLADLASAKAAALQQLEVGLGLGMNSRWVPQHACHLCCSAAQQHGTEHWPKQSWAALSLFAAER